MILLGEGIVFTRDKNQPMITRGAVVMDGDTIIAVGGYDQLREQYNDAQVIDAHGGIIMPGFINVHHHIYSALARGLSLSNFNPSNFLEILEGQWFRIDKGLKHDDTRASAIATYMSCIENGVTTIFDHHASYGETEGSLSIIAKEAKRFGVRSCLCYEVSDRNGREEMERAVAENLKFMEEAKKDSKNLAAMMGLHASFTLSDETLDYVVKENKENAGYHVHVAEGQSDVEDCMNKYGVRTVERLYSKGILGKKTLAGHCIHVNKQEIARLVETDTMVVHNPESNMGNAVGAPDVLSLYNAGVLIGLGTDGYTSDMMESYKAGNCLIKHREQNPNVGWSEIPTMLFENNEKIARRYFEQPMGVLKQGATADVIVLDYIPYTPMDETNFNSHLLFGVNGMNVITTIAGGKVRMKDRVLMGMDKKELLNDVCEQTKSLWNRLNKGVDR